MRSAFRSVVLLLLVSCPVLMKAVTIRTQDPTYGNLTAPPSPFTFGSCAGVLYNGQQVSGDGCFVAENETGVAITSITLAFADTQAIVDSGANDAESTDIWSNNSAMCANGFCTFTYSDGSLPTNSFVQIIETGVPFDEFPTVTYTYNVTPEPTSALLLATGIICTGGLSFQRRRG